ncbi:MAG: DUF1573 domain-containing protein [Phycisphaerales bacterium]
MHTKSTRITQVLMAAASLCLGASVAIAQGVDTKPTTAPKTLTPAPAATQPVPGGKPNLDSHSGVQPSEASQSPLTWESMSHDFGNIPDTAPVTHVFKFKNNTDHTVTILRAHGSCGCTVPDLTKKSFQPGESGEMQVTFNPQGRRGQNPKAVTVEFSDPPGTPQTVVTINSNVQPLVMIEPQKTYLQEVDSKSGSTTVITVSGRKADFAVTGVEKRTEALDVQIGQAHEVDIDGEKFQQIPVTVTVKPGTPIGDIQTELIIRTNDERSPSHNHVFFAAVVGDIKATPTKLTLRAFTPKVPFSNVVTLENRNNTPFKVTSVDIDGRDDMMLVADVEETSMNGRQTYTIKLNGVTPDVQGLITGELVINTDLPNNATLRIPFSATIRGSQAGTANVPGKPVPVGN